MLTWRKYLLSEDRIRGNLEGRKSEDLKFLQDQRGERKMTMRRLDEEFSRKKAAQLERKLGSAPSSTITSQDILYEDQNKSFGESSPIKDNRDNEYNIQENKGRRWQAWTSLLLWITPTSTTGRLCRLSHPC